ncbi:TetR/AcrR family transcriptional regulator [Gordonia hankookensis]|uniref:TetR/AcrR family transcriptional regulator n=1 Tax=Gordonia hankookensis TaxID=589403 RepID=A0ABR7WCA5_9ACTN|nr:TetR/AcrR family transcriptional regulator [Gordonia hankookensis]MBD1320434.1 TetR/AcrR family transcriptional regulator [Gordonia hankookensis]
MSICKEDIRDQVLDAARRCLVRNNGRKVTVAEVAREAGVSRPTVYRRWPDMSEIIRALLTREVLGVVAAVNDVTPLRTADFDATVDVVVRVVAALRDDELVSALWREQREFMMPYVFDRLGTSQQGVLAILSDAIANGQARGQVRDGDPDKMAAMVLLITQSSIQSRALVESILGDEWSHELHHALSSYLRPLDDLPAAT